MALLVQGHRECLLALLCARGQRPEGCEGLLTRLLQEDVHLAQLATQQEAAHGRCRGVDTCEAGAHGVGPRRGLEQLRKVAVDTTKRAAAQRPRVAARLERGQRIQRVLRCDELIGHRTQRLSGHACDPRVQVASGPEQAENPRPPPRATQRQRVLCAALLQLSVVAPTNHVLVQLRPLLVQGGSLLGQLFELSRGSVFGQGGRHAQ